MTENPFRNYSTHGYAKAVLDLGLVGVFDDMRTQTVKIGSLIGKGRLWGASTWELGLRNEDFSFGGTITSGNISKLGTGVMEITSDLASSGTFTINNGGVVITGTSSGPGSSRVIVRAGTHLSGNGGVNGDITVDRDGILYAGYYSPETPVVGSSFRTNNVRLLSGARFRAQVDLSANRSDRMTSLGNFIANGVLEMINVSDLPYEAGMSFQLIRRGNISGQFESVVPETPGEGLVWDLSSFTTDGTIRVALATSLEENRAKGQISLFPNPGDGLFMVELPDAHGDILVKVENLQGQELMHSTLPYGAEPVLDLRSLGKGMYLVHLLFQGDSYSTKVIIQ